VLLILVFAVFFPFIVLAVQFNSLKLPALILGSVPFCVAGSAGLLLATGKPLGATVVIGVPVVLAAVVNAGVLLLSTSPVGWACFFYPREMGMASICTVSQSSRFPSSSGQCMGFRTAWAQRACPPYGTTQTSYPPHNETHPPAARRGYWPAALAIRPVRGVKRGEP
jgi:hypothetical protein